jgi:two-component system phosphate regulon sensor histidine kinase PhoR
MRFRAPANVLLRRAQLVLMLAVLMPTVLMSALGIVLLAFGSSSVGIVIGVLVLAFCTSSITGYILGSIFVSRGASMARVQNDFLSGVSHELRTPLTSIRMFMETLRDERLTDAADQEQCLTLLSQEVERLQALVERLIQLSRIETGKHEFEREAVAVNDMVSDALTAFDTATLPTRVPVDMHIEPDLYVLGDRAALAQTLSNLLTNAWKYTPDDDKQIAVEVHAMREKWVELKVSDNGPGIPKAEQRHIFDKFERGKDAIDRHTRGVGLGLATVRAIVREHRGRIEVRSEGGQGAVFRIMLRRHRGAPVQTAQHRLDSPA